MTPNQTPQPRPDPARPDPGVRPRSDTTVYFIFQGRRFRLFKRYEGPTSKYYVRLIIKEKLHKKCLETSIAEIAKANAKVWIAKLLAQKWEDVEKLKARRTVSTVGDVLDHYPKFAGILPVSIEHNTWALDKMVRTVCCKTDEEREFRAVSLLEVNRSLVEKFQAAMVLRYEQKAVTEDGRRAARELALRSSRSIVCGARSLFNKQRGLVEKYENAGLIIPECVTGTPREAGFMTCSLLGRMTKGNYVAPPDSVVQKALIEIGEVADSDRNVFLAFWLAVGAGLRRSEIHKTRWEYWIEREGVTWISGGIGKDGQQIEVPIQTRAAEALKRFRKEAGPVIENEKSCTSWAARLNYWMKMHGWNTEKKMHELRAYVGSLIYRRNPMAAMQFMRHKSIQITEQFYVRYGTQAQVPNVL